MNKILKLIVITLLVSNITTKVQAQAAIPNYKGIINGFVKTKTGHPLEMAHIQLENTKFGTYTDANGKFILTDIPQGNYKIIVTNIGYEPTVQELTVNLNETRTVQLEIAEKVQNLTEVSVIGRIGVTQIEPQKVRFSVKDLSSQNGGTAGDILKNMISVAMGGSPNHNRDIRYRGLGNGYTTVLINGKSSGIMGNNRETVLDMIPASQIDYIEILSNPSADNTANGINGIVNIVLKKGKSPKKQSGQISFYADNQKGSNGNIALQYNTDNLNLSGSFDKLKRDANKYDNGTQTKLNTDGSIKETVAIKKSELKSFDNTTASGRVGYITKNNFNIVGEYLFGEQFENKDKEELNITYKTDGTFKSGKNRLETENKQIKFYNPSIAVSKFWKNSSVEFDVNANFSDEDKDKLIQEYSTKPDASTDYTKLPMRQTEIEQINFKNYFPSVAFQTKIGSTGTIKTGLQGFLTNRSALKNTKKLNNTTNIWEIIPNNTNQFNLTENTFASYVTSNWDLNKFKMILGYRHEITNLDSESINTSTIHKKSDYQIALPNLSLTYSITDNNYLKSSIGRRVRRPAFNDLNPTIEIKSATEIKVGNPDLKAEKAWAYEVGYFGEIKKLNFGVNLFHRDINDLIQKNITTENGITTESFINLNRAVSSGTEFLMGVAPVKWYNLNLNYTKFWSEIKDNSNFNGDALKDQTEWTFKAISNFNFNGGFNVQILTNWVGPKKTFQESEKTIWFTDLGIEKAIYTNGVFTLRVTDVFDTLKKEKSKNTIVQTETMTENTPGTIVSAGLRWQF